jgi:16S rRNA (uracil1498-N3)-methyltransferase
LAEASRKKVTLHILEQTAKQPIPPLNIHLGLGLSKGDRMDWAIQKATELGVTSIAPLITEYSTLKISEDRVEKKLLHWLGIIQSACEQSGRCYLPELHQPVSLNKWVNDRISNHDDALKLVLNPHQGQSISSQTCDNNLVLLIGPEGGLSEKEIQTANDNGFISIQLGNLVLRTETAPVAAIAAAQTLWGNFK